MISERFKKVILKQLKLNDFNFSDETRAYQIPGWDSLNHVIMLAVIEKEYGIRFKTVEVLRLKNLGDLQVLVDNKIANSKK
ncbi:MAG: acyl carrier protein [Candidatus Omnitrophota bacterium]|jgi:acyl carrier protein